MDSAAGQHRLKELDALRGVAAFIVLLYHYTVRYGEVTGDTARTALRVPLGNFGVQLFFIISGFVILMTIDRAASVREFAIARFARLFPAFWAACVVTFGAVLAFGLQGRSIPWSDAWLNLTMIPRALGARMIDPVYWTLQEELLFYVVMALVFAAGLRKWVFFVMAAMIGASIAGVELFRWMGLFAIGMVIFDSRRGVDWKHGMILVLALADAYLRPVWPDSSIPEQPRMWYAVVICVLAAVVTAATRFRLPWLASPVPVFLGTISYSWYLVHQNVGYIVIRESRELGASATWSVVIAAAASIALASILAFGIERPAYRLIRDRLKRTPPHQSALSAPALHTAPNAPPPGRG